MLNAFSNSKVTLGMQNKPLWKAGMTLPASTLSKIEQRKKAESERVLRESGKLKNVSATSKVVESSSRKLKSALQSGKEILRAALTDQNVSTMKPYYFLYQFYGADSLDMPPGWIAIKKKGKAYYQALKALPPEFKKEVAFAYLRHGFNKQGGLKEEVSAFLPLRDRKGRFRFAIEGLLLDYIRQGVVGNKAQSSEERALEVLRELYALPGEVPRGLADSILSKTGSQILNWDA